MGILSRVTIGLLTIAAGAALALPASASEAQHPSSHTSARVTDTASALAWHAKSLMLGAPRNAVIPNAEHDGLRPSVLCGGGVVNVYWDNNSVQPWGSIWDNCGSGSYVQIYVKYSTLGLTRNYLAATAGPNSTSSHPYYWGPNFYNDPLPGNIYVTACEHFDGWSCGTPVKA